VPQLLGCVVSTFSIEVYGSLMPLAACSNGITSGKMRSLATTYYDEQALATFILLPETAKK
jgi:hypothetical protein